MDVTFMRRATAPLAMSGTAEDEDEGEEEEGGPAAGRRAPGRQEIHLAGRRGEDGIVVPLRNLLHKFSVCVHMGWCIASLLLQFALSDSCLR